MVAWELNGTKYLKGKHSNRVYELLCPNGSDERHELGIWQPDTNTMEWHPEFDPAFKPESSVFSNMFGIFDIANAPAADLEQPYSTPMKGNIPRENIDGDDMSIGGSSWKVGSTFTSKKLTIIESRKVLIFDFFLRLF